MRTEARLVAVAVCLLPCACGAPPAPPASERVDTPVRATFAEAERAPVDAGRVADDWLAAFGDARLDALVAEAQRNNPDLAAAVARRDRALAQAGFADSAFAPKVDAGLSSTRADAGTPAGAANRFDLGLTVSWEVDVWGRIAKTSAAAAADAVAAAADLEYARQSIAARTAQAWFLAIAGRELVALEQALTAQRERLLRITQARFDVGEAKPSDVALAEGQLAATRDALTAAGGGVDAALRSLDALLGRYPAADIEVAPGLPALPPPPPVGLPSELLERRPDVVAADRRVAAAFQRIGAAKAAKLPRVALTAGGGLSSGDLSSLLDPKQAAWNLGANLLGPLFDGGEREAQVRIAQANEQEALANYVKAAQRAFFEVETALGNERVLRQREGELAGAAAQLLRARDATEARYREGDATILDVSQVHDDHARAARALVQVRQELLQQRLNLHLALGGSFAARPTPAASESKR
jgi:NodT family efflux transporter outer membrane factor (OMF) lipoprotein